MLKKFFHSEFFIYFVLVLSIFLLRTFLFSPSIVKGASMNPTLTNNEFVFGLKNSKIERFDIVTFPSPINSKERYIKRVIGLPGDVIKMQDDLLFINNVETAEPYLDTYKAQLAPGQKFTIQNFTVKVPEDSCFVMGDNRPHSFDSRYPEVGFIAQKDIILKVKAAIWPPKKWGKVE